MTSRRIESSDVAGVTLACSNLQILFTSTLQFCAIEIVNIFREKMPNRCVAASCSNVPDSSKSIGLHKFPVFVRTKGPKWSPTHTSRLCSRHFKADDFESPFITIPGTALVSRMILKKDAVPTIHSQKAEASNADNDNSADSCSNRQHRSVSKIVHICTYFTICFSI